MSARELKRSVVTNCYWATAAEDARLWLGPVCDAGVDDLSLSDDEFHNPEGGESPARRAAEVARALGLPASSICIEAPAVQPPADDQGAPVVGGGALFKGRALIDRFPQYLTPRQVYGLAEG